MEDGGANGGPSDRVLKIGRRVNFVGTSLGMVSLGLLAMLITHHDLKEQEAPGAAIAVADAISFSTAILGKVAIVLYFNEPIFLRNLTILYTEGLGSFFKIPKRSPLEHAGWAFNYLLSLNVSLFWAGIAQISFIQSADILDKLDSKSAHDAGAQIRQWYIFSTFVACSFYANWLIWPGIHQYGYHQMKGALQSLLETRSYQNLKRRKESEINHAHHELMKEIQRSFADSFVDTPRLNAIVDALPDDSVTRDTPLLLKIDSVISAGENNLQQLRKAYLMSNHTVDSRAPAPSRIERAIRQGSALLLTGAAIWGFHNFLGLNDVVWTEWKLPQISTYAGRYAAFFSAAEIISLTVYPMFYGLTGMFRRGIPAHAISNTKLTFIMSMVGFVGIFGGLANAEQSYLDNESVPDIILSDFASFVLDAFAIYMVMRTYFERGINESTKKDPTTVLKQKFLRLRGVSGKASTMSESELYDLIENQNNDTVRSAGKMQSLHVSESDSLIGGSTHRMFHCFEKPLRRLFNMQEEVPPSVPIP